MMAKIKLEKTTNDLYYVVITNGYGNELYMTDKISKEEALQWIRNFKTVEVEEI